MYREKLIFAGRNVHSLCGFIISSRYANIRFRVFFVYFACSHPKGCFFNAEKENSEYKYKANIIFEEVIFCLIHFYFFGGIIFETVKSIFTFNG